MQSSYGVKVFSVSNRNDGSIKVKYYEGLNFNTAHEHDTTEVFNNAEELYNFIISYSMSKENREYLSQYLPQEMQVRINRLNGDSMLKCPLKRVVIIQVGHDFNWKNWQNLSEILI